MKKGLLYSTNIEFLDPKPINSNPLISKVKIRIAEAGPNRNGFIIPKEVLSDAAERTLGLCPIVAVFNQYKGDFGEHGFQAILDSNGEYVTTEDTQAVGVIPENPEIYWDEDGYLVTYGYLWTSRYEEIVLALEGRPQSMELDETKTVMKKAGNMIEILETAFEGLCILGEDVTPAFRKASIKGAEFGFSYIGTDTKEVEKGVDTFMKDLKFALDSNFDDTALVVDTDGEERDIENRKKVTEAIDVLDEVSDEIEDPENLDKIGDAITSLVDAETAMTREAAVIPATKKAQDALKGQPSGEDGIVTTDSMSYSQGKNSNSLLKKKKEETADENKEESEVSVKKKKIIKDEETVDENVEAAPAVETKEETVVEKPEQKDVITEEGETKAVAEEVAPEEEAVPTDDGAVDPKEQEPVTDEKGGFEPPAEITEDGTTFEETGEVDAEVPADPQGETATAIATERKTAESKRASAALDDVSDEELYNYLIERVKSAEDAKSRLEEIFGTADTQLPNEGEVSVTGDIAQEDLGSESIEIQDMPGGNEEATTETEVAETEENKPEVAEETVEISEETTDEENPVEEETSTDTETKEEVPAEEDTETEEEKKKKKGNFSLDFKAIVSENIQLNKEIEILREENDKLLEFKLEIENQTKEDLLNQFSISDEAKEAIKLDFKLLSLEDRKSVV